MDNLLTEGKTIPMIVGRAGSACVAPELTTVTSPNFDATIAPYLNKNQEAVDGELFHDVIPFIENPLSAMSFGASRRGTIDGWAAVD